MAAFVFVGFSEIDAVLVTFGGFHVRACHGGVQGKVRIWIGIWTHTRLCRTRIARNTRRPPARPGTSPDRQSSTSPADKHPCTDPNRDVVQTVRFDSTADAEVPSSFGSRIKDLVVRIVAFIMFDLGRLYVVSDLSALAVNHIIRRFSADVSNGIHAVVNIVPILVAEQEV